MLFVWFAQEFYMKIVYLSEYLKKARIRLRFRV